MEIEFDARKSERSAAERGLPFDLVAEFEWQTAIFREDLRHSYPERRFVALGSIGARVHAVCFTPLGVAKVRVISFRKANRREVRRYEQEAAH